MKILFLDAPAFAKQDMIDAFEECGIECELFIHEKYKERIDRDYERPLIKKWKRGDMNLFFHLIIILFFRGAARNII